MPEGDVVWRTARRLHGALADRPLTLSDFRWPSLAEVDLTGRRVIETVSAGKHLLTRVDGGLSLHNHLRMDGSWHLHATGQPWARPRRQDGVRAVLANEEWTAVGHLLGMLEIVRIDDESTVVGHLGPDVLGPGWDVEEVLRRLRTAGDRPVGEALLDQRVLAGVGTFYMSETCFLRGITPWVPVADVDDLSAMVQLAHRLMDLNKERAVQTTTGDSRLGQREWVHGRSGRPCRRCGAILRVAMVGAAPRQRTAFYCPVCQLGPTGEDDHRAQRPLGAGVKRRRPGRREGSSGSG